MPGRVNNSRMASTATPCMATLTTPSSATMRAARSLREPAYTDPAGRLTGAMSVPCPPRTPRASAPLRLLLNEVRSDPPALGTSSALPGRAGGDTPSYPALSKGPATPVPTQIRRHPNRSRLAARNISPNKPPLPFRGPDSPARISKPPCPHHAVETVALDKRKIAAEYEFEKQRMAEL